MSDRKDKGEVDIIAGKVAELWQKLLQANIDLPESERLILSASPTCAELREARVGHYLRYCRDDPGKIALGRWVHGARDIAVGECLTYEPAIDRFLLGVPRARPWSHGFDRLNWYLVPEGAITLILKNIIADKPVQNGLELYKTQY